MVLIPSILQIVVSCERPRGIGALFVILAYNYDLDFISHSTFIISSIGRSSSRHFFTDVQTNVIM